MQTMERVNELIDEREISLFQLSEMAQIPYSTLQTAKRRKTQLSVETIEHICKALDISLSDFFADAG